MSKSISELTLTDIQAEIRRLADEQPDHVYERYGQSCVYVADDGEGNLVGSCIVGRALVNLGVEPETLTFYIVPTADTLLTSVDLVGPEVSWIQDVQSEQDYGITWSKAIAYADCKDSE